MRFKVVNKRLIYIDEGYNITKGENNNELITIDMPRYPNGSDTDYLSLSHRLTVTSVEDSTIAACAILNIKELGNDKIRLSCPVTQDITSVGKEAFFKVTSVGSNDFIDITECSAPIKINGNSDGDRFSSDTDIEKIVAYAQLAAQKADDAAKNANKSAEMTNDAVQKTNAAALKVENAVKNVSKLINGSHLSPASETNAGYVIVDGETITATDDGIISVSKSIAEMQNLAVQIAHPNNSLIYDDVGKPSVMVAIPKFYLDEVIDGAPHTVHPAFIINGTEQNAIYISKYQNIVENGRAYSLPMKDPAVNVTFDQAWNYCKNKGNGWHVITNAEWAAIALWCKKNGTMPKGNNNYGKDISETDLPQKAIPANIGSDSKINRVLTGSGRETWYHDGTFAGIAGLNGNIWEWIGDIRLVYGELQAIHYNNAASSYTDTSTKSAQWKAIKANAVSWDELFITPNGSGTTADSVKLDFVSGHWQWGTSITDKLNASRSSTFAAATSAGISTITKLYLQSMALLPVDGTAPDIYRGDYFWANNGAEEICALRGGYWHVETRAGVFGLYFCNTRCYSDLGIGGRCAYYE